MENNTPNKEEYKKTAQCPFCQNLVRLDKTGNHKEKYIQCDLRFCGEIFKNPFYTQAEGEKDATK